MKNLRDFLEQRERQLTEQLAERRRQTIPYEAELAEIRQAKKALGTDAPDAPTLLTMNELRAYLESRERELRETIAGVTGSLEAAFNELAEVRKVKATIGLRHTKGFEVGIDAVGDPLWKTIPEVAGGIPYQSTTIRELIIKALKEEFRDGISMSLMIAFFREKWGREIDRGSLSPQLSRLFKAGIIGRVRSIQFWFLIQPELRIAGQRPYLRSGKIIWMDKDQATQVCEPLITRDIGGLDDRMPYIRRMTERIPNGTRGVEKLLWLLPHEVQVNDHPALRHEVPTGDGDLARAIVDARLLSVVSGERSPEEQAVLNVLKKKS